MLPRNQPKIEKSEDVCPRPKSLRRRRKVISWVYDGCRYSISTKFNEHPLAQTELCERGTDHFSVYITMSN